MVELQMISRLSFDTIMQGLDYTLHIPNTRIYNIVGVMLSDSNS